MWFCLSLAIMVRFCDLRIVLCFALGRWNVSDRLDPVYPAMSVDERSHDIDRRSSSAIAKYTEILGRISFA